MSMKFSGLAVAGMSMMAAGVPPVFAQDADDALIRGFKNGKAIVDVNVRYEQVDDDNFDDDAKGLTVRTRLGYETAPMAGFRLLGEFTDTRPLFGVDNYSPETAGFPTIADPSNTEVNRAIISYSAFDDLLWLAGGRQRIILDNARWVGNVGWRQKEQTYDAGSVDLNFGADWALSYDYITQVQTINATTTDVKDHLVNLSFSGWQIGQLVAYAYLVNDEDADNKSDSYGLRFNGSVKPNNLSFLYTAEYASQTAKNAMSDKFNVNYYTLMLGLGFQPVTLKVGYEVLGSDGGDYGLQTALATKHAFNGWADLFLTTPDNGLRDLYVDLGANWLGIKWAAIYHDFSADEGSDRYGSEIDLLAVKKFNKHYTVGIKYANFRVDSDVEDSAEYSLRDLSKFWVWFNFKY